MQMPVTDWFRKWEGIIPDNVAVKEQETGRTLTYKQLHVLGEQYAFYLKDVMGVKKGDRIIVLAENCLEYIMLLSAAQKSGIVIIPLNYRLTPSEIDYLLTDSDPVMGIVEDKYLAKVEGLDSYRKIRIKTDLASFAGLARTLEEPVPSFNPESPVMYDDPLFLIYTSGTTAFPKGSVYTHGMMFWNSLNTHLRLDVVTADRAMNMAPPFHTGSWNVLLTPFLHHGAYTLILKSFDPDQVLRLLDEDRHTLFWAVPTMLKMMADSPLFNEVDLSRIRYFVVGGEAMPRELIEKWHRKGVAIRQGYGLTEVGPNVTSLNHEDAIRKLGSIGVPNFYYETRIVDEQGNDVPANVPGEFLLKGPNVTPGYWRNPKATKETIVNGWFHTGDLVRRDEEGFIYVVDRIKNMYISGAENVYPAEVEHLLRQHQAVDSVAVFGVPDEKWGETGMACIRVKPGMSVTVEELKNFTAGKLAKYKIPAYFVFMDELPKNDAGKIDRKFLKNNYREHLNQ